MRRRDFLVGGLAAAQWAPLRAFAQGTLQGIAAAPYPTRPIHIIVPSSAGGVHDVIARIWADRVKTALGAVVVENRGGGGASIALNYVAQSQPDGYVLLLARATACKNRLQGRTAVHSFSPWGRRWDEGAPAVRYRNIVTPSPHPLPFGARE